MMTCLKTAAPACAFRLGRPQGGSVLIIVLWVALGLVSIALYFGNSMSLEMRAADNRVAILQSQQAIAGAERYVSYVLSNRVSNSAMPDPTLYEAEMVPVGASYFWLIGRQTNNTQTSVDTPFFGLIDEASKLNLNTATADMLQYLPGMTPQLADAIIDWRDADENVTTNGAESSTYLGRIPAYHAKNAKFETLDELRLVFGAELYILQGEDANMNGVLDLNENDSDTSPPSDNRDGHLDSGLFEYLTVYSRESVLRDDGSGSNKVNIATAQSSAIQSALAEKLSSDRASQIVASLGSTAATNLLQFYIRSGMTADEFAQVEGLFCASDTPKEGLVNVNTASETVLACIPGIGTDKAPSLVAYRQTASDKLKTIAWVLDVLDQASALQAAPYLTTHSYQFTADVAAVGNYGRGYQRVKFVFDTSSGTPQVMYRQDLTRLGWALGPTTRTLVLSQMEKRW
jgi:type II secretory pathway component PulK